MNDQQTLVDRIVALAIEISQSRTATKFVAVAFDGFTNQLTITYIPRNDYKRRDCRAIDLHEPGEPEIARERVNRLLREEFSNLQCLHRNSTSKQQRLLP